VLTCILDPTIDISQNQQLVSEPGPTYKPCIPSQQFTRMAMEFPSS